MDRIEHLHRFDYHFNDVFIAVHFSTLFSAERQKEYVHVFISL
jgi:hypothetical protein